MAIWLVALFPAAAESPAVPHLSPVQARRVAQDIGKLKHPEERALASGWSDAKKAAEFICRPLALATLRHRFKGADRVFLGTDDPDTLRLVSDRRLEGSGQVRVGSDWKLFRFVCALDPKTGKALSFRTAPAGAPLSHYLAPGPVRSPSFNPKNWPGSGSR